MQRLVCYFILMLTALCCYPASWVATWSCAPQQAGNNDLPHGEDLSGCAVRQVVHVSLGGDKLRLCFSNEHSTDELEIRSVSIANLGGEHYAIDPASATDITFMTERSVKIPAGSMRLSDPVNFHLEPLQKLVISINYGKVPQFPTVHSGSRTTSYILAGEADSHTDFSNARQEQHWYSICGVDVLTSKSTECIACLGNSITDGRGVTTDADNRWTDVLAEQLGGEVGVLNLGIGGNCVLSGGLGPTAKERFNSDILAKAGVSRVIIFEGINDIGSSKATPETADKLIKAYQRFIRKAHDAGLKIYGATITPMKGSDYYTPEHEAIRLKVNQWILTSGEFDGVLDPARVLANPKDNSELNPKMRFDALHPNPEGYRAIGELFADYFIQQLNIKSKTE